MPFNKTTFEQFIHKYYLGGLIKSITIQSDGTGLQARAITSDHNLVVELSSATDTELPKGEYHVYDSAALLAMLSVVKDPCTVSVNYNKDNAPTSLIFDDGQSRATFVLAHGSAIEKISAIKRPSNVEVEFGINGDLASQFIRANSALDAKQFVVQSDGAEVALTINYSEQNTSRVKIPVSAHSRLVIPTLYFNVDYLSAILKANAAILKQTSAMMSVSNVKDGFVQIQFPEFSLSYYLVGEKASQ